MGGVVGFAEFDSGVVLCKVRSLSGLFVTANDQSTVSLVTSFNGSM